jgi:hypothetical protein
MTSQDREIDKEAIQQGENNPSDGFLRLRNHRQCGVVFIGLGSEDLGSSRISAQQILNK